MVFALDLLPAGLFGLLVMLESVRSAPARDRRWLANGGLFVVNGLLALVLVRHTAADQEIGWLVWVGGLLFMDLVHYGGHRLMHAVPVLWRAHVVHHNDLDLDVTTSLRTHPFEFLVLYSVSAGMAALAGVPGAVIAGYGIVVFCVEMLQHARLSLPDPVERALRLVFVTPGYHRLHHAPERAVHDSNYGAVFTLWDRAFGTMRLPAAPGDPPIVGVPGYEQPRQQSLPGLLTAPLGARFA
jgi:sterol desaturase/sphingolipid hydroxylase (fatty acid hydroxylase superfamily)